MIVMYDIMASLKLD